MKVDRLLSRVERIKVDIASRNTDGKFFGGKQLGWKFERELAVGVGKNCDSAERNWDTD
jgi:hypothetical protein